MQLPSSTRNLKESDYRALAQQLAQKYSLPFFPAQIQQESGYDPGAVSNMGAQGIAQIMPTTAQSWGVDPNDPVAALTSAAEHMRGYMDKYGNDPRQALAAYNEGEGNLAKYGVTGLPETANYVQTILGAHQTPADASQAPMAAQGPDFSSLAPGSLPASLQTPSFVDEPLSSSLQSAAGLSSNDLILQSIMSGQGLPSPLQMASMGTGLSDPLGSLASSIQQQRTRAATMPDFTGQMPGALPRPSFGSPSSGFAPSSTQPSFTPTSKGSTYPLAEAPSKPIGVPYQGTHKLYGNWESDNAVDISAPVGTPVRAVSAGTIGPQFGALSSKGDPRLEGLRLHLVGPGNEWYYAHLSRFAPGIKPGVRVQPGQVIGYSGEANGVSHLHLGQREGSPLDLLKAATAQR